jgi:hypothetical protein
LSHTSSLILLWLFWRLDLVNCFPGLALNHDTPDLRFLSSMEQAWATGAQLTFKFLMSIKSIHMQNCFPKWLCHFAAVMRILVVGIVSYVLVLTFPWCWIILSIISCVYVGLFFCELSVLLLILKFVFLLNFKNSLYG